MSLEERLDALRVEAGEVRNFTIAFLALLLYTCLIVASTTHEHILRMAPLKLPLFEVDIPLVGFYRAMPILVFFLHLYILVQHYLFSRQVFAFAAAVRRRPPHEQGQLCANLGHLPFCMGC